jgi:hypothetical protein
VDRLNVKIRRKEHSALGRLFEPRDRGISHERLPSCQPTVARASLWNSIHYNHFIGINVARYQCPRLRGKGPEMQLLKRIEFLRLKDVLSKVSGSWGRP